MPYTYLETFRCSTADVLAAAVNKHAERKGLEILSISVNVDEKARYRYEAIVLFEKQSVNKNGVPPVVEAPPIKYG